MSLSLDLSRARRAARFFRDHRRAATGLPLLAPPVPGGHPPQAPRLQVVLLAFAPISPILAARAAPVQTRRERALLERWAKIYSRFNEVLSGIVTVKSFTREEEEKRRFVHDVADANHLVIQGVHFDGRLQAG